jgi:hypothetical protein
MDSARMEYKIKDWSVNLMETGMSGNPEDGQPNDGS